MVESIARTSEACLARALPWTYGQFEATSEAPGWVRIVFSSSAGRDQFVKDLAGGKFRKKKDLGL